MVLPSALKKRKGYVRAVRRSAYKPDKDSKPAFGLEDLLLNHFRAAVLDACNQNRTYAANALGISCRGFRLWLKNMTDRGYSWDESRGGGHPDNRPKPDEEKIEALRQYAMEHKEALERRLEDEA